MKYLGQFLRAFVISPEVILLLALGLLILRFPEIATKVGETVNKEQWTQYLLVGAPVAVILMAYKLVRSILHSDEAEKKGLYQWSYYRLLKLRAYLGMGWCVFSFVVSVCLLFAIDSLPVCWVGAIYGLVIVTSLTSLGSVALASLKITGILRGDRQ